MATRTRTRTAPTVLVLDAPQGRLTHSAPGLTPIAPEAPSGPALLTGPTELARWIRAIVGAPASLRLRYRAEEGGWRVVRSGAFVGRNVPTVRAAIEGCVAVDGRIYLLDRSDVTDKTSLADIAAAEQAIRAIMGTLPRLARSEQPRRALGARRPALPGREVS